MQARLKLIKAGNPLDPETMIGSQVSKAQCDKILNYINIGKEEGAVVLAGGEAGNHEETFGGYHIQPTVLKGTNDMRVFQEEILDQL
jgi:aldehyde dehydrogenase (NAD+)/aldehyde dehydrogenase